MVETSPGFSMVATFDSAMLFEMQEKKKVIVYFVCHAVCTDSSNNKMNELERQKVLIHDKLSSTCQGSSSVLNHLIFLLFCAASTRLLV